eukprot:SAG31_NODE_1772_length_7306_cov_3.341335_7_plen_92_part_00
MCLSRLFVVAIAIVFVVHHIYETIRLVISGREIAKFSIETADPAFGDFVSKDMTWNNGVSAIPVSASVESVSLKVAIRGAKLYSLELVCAE